MKTYTIDQFDELADKYGISHRPWEKLSKKTIDSMRNQFSEICFALSFLDNPESLPILEALLDDCSPADLLSTSSNAIVWAATKTALSFEKLTMLLRMKPDFVKEHLHDVDSEGQTVLHHFAEYRYPDVRTMKLLIELGADINAVDDLGWTISHHFAYNEECNCSNALFPMKPIVVINKNGHTPADIERMGSDIRMPFTYFYLYEPGRKKIDYKELIKDRTFEEDGFMFIFDETAKTAKLEHYSGDSDAVAIPEAVVKSGTVYLVTAVESLAFERKSIRSIQVPKSVGKFEKSVIGTTVLDDRCLENIDVEDDNPVFSSIGGVLFDKDKKTLLKYPKGNKRKRYAIPGGVARIGKNAFAECWRLKSVTIPDSVTHMGEGAFLGCKSLSQIDLPSRLTHMGDYLFLGCNTLRNVLIPEGASKIGSQAFHFCKNLEEVYIPESVIDIGHGIIDGSRASKAVIDVPGSIGRYEAFFGSRKVRITGRSGSYAEQYAKENGFPFHSQKVE